MLTRRQICCLLCLAFFNSFEPQQGNYQHFTLSDYFSFTKSKSQQGKLLCVLNYFERIRKSEEVKEEDYLSMCVSVLRRSLDPAEANREMWKACEKPLLSFESFGGGMIENAHGCLQVDFADEYIGGNVLGMGCVQVRDVIDLLSLPVETAPCLFYNFAGGDTVCHQPRVPRLHSILRNDDRVGVNFDSGG